MDRFDEWIRFAFDRPVGDKWYWADEAEVEFERWCSDPKLNVEYLNELLRRPEALEPFSRDQVAQGFWFLLGHTLPNFNDDFYNTSVDLDLRVACIRAASGFFESFIGKHCDGRDPKSKDDLEGLAFMWWDLWLDGFARKGSPDVGVIDAAALETLEEIGRMPSLACIAAALHGLNHKAAEHPREVDRIVEAMLERSSGWPADLVEYANKARRGEWQ